MEVLDSDMIMKLLLAAAAVISLCLMIRGLMDMQKINAADADVLEIQGVVRRLSPCGRDHMAVLTLCVEDAVEQVDCLLPAPWLGRSRRQVTDLVRVLWRRGDKRAVAVQTIRSGQATFIIGILILAATGLAALLLL